jgi:hypothetical protein
VLLLLAEEFAMLVAAYGRTRDAIYFLPATTPWYRSNSVPLIEHNERSNATYLFRFASAFMSAS